MKVLLVTGGSRGIGAVVCRVAASRGWAVCVNYRHSEQAAGKVVSAIREAGGHAIAVKADVSVDSDVKRLLGEVDRQLGRLSGLINNAGINGRVCRVEELDATVSRRLFEVNILGPFLCAKHAIKRMAKRYGGNGGVIVNVSSAASRHGGAGSYVDYAASKGALDTFTIGLAREQAQEGIRVNSLRPGATMTELSVEWANQNPDWLEWVMQQVPLGRPANTVEIANSAVWLLSDEASYVTGACLDVSGGWVSP